MLHGIEQVLSGRTYLPEHLVDLLLTTENAGASGSTECEAVDTTSVNSSMKLSKRQQQILQMVERGLSNKQIANLLGISISTVKFHITAVYKILGVKTRT